MPHTFSIHTVVPETPRTALVRLDLGGRPFPYRAGQAVLVGAHGRPDPRPYSLAGGPEDSADAGLIELLVGLETDGSPGPHMPALAPGAPIDVEGPMGTFQFPESPRERHFLFVAGGSGIAPLRAMLQHALRRDPAWRLSLLYSARTPDEFAFAGELWALADAGRLRLHCTVTRHAGNGWTGARGRIGRPQLEPVLETVETRCFVCGPHALVEDVPRQLAALGVPPDRVVIEDWGA